MSRTSAGPRIVHDQSCARSRILSRSPDRNRDNVTLLQLESRGKQGPCRHVRNWLSLSLHANQTILLENSYGFRLHYLNFSFNAFKIIKLLELFNNLLKFSITILQWNSLICMQCLKKPPIPSRAFTWVMAPSTVTTFFRSLTP